MPRQLHQCNIKGRSVYFATKAVRKQVELVLIVVFIDQLFENGFGVRNEANESAVVTQTLPSYTSLADTLRYKTRSND